MKAVVAPFNQEKALVGTFSVIVQPVVEPMEHYTALLPGRLHDDGLHPRGGAAPHDAAALAAAQHRTGLQNNINTYFALMVYFLFGIISLNLLRHASNGTFYV